MTLKGLRAYCASNKCPKCESLWADTQFCTGGFLCWIRDGSAPTEPHMDRRCKVCGYAWAELPLDKVMEP